MKNFYVRTITGAIFALAVLGSILWDPWAFFVLMGIFAIGGLYEFFPLIYPKGKGTLLYYLVGIMTYILVALTLISFVDFSYILLIILGLFIIMAAELFRFPNPSFQRIGGSFAGILYVAIPFGMMNSFFYMKSGTEAAPMILLALFVLVWVNDVFAYLAGSRFGRHKLYEKISPKKTWEGTVTGAIFTLFTAGLFYVFVQNLTLYQWLGFGFIVAVSADIGDLVESLLKRNAGVKDTGNLLPGHGGVLDRFDAVLFATPFVFYYLFLL